MKIKKMNLFNTQYDLNFFFNLTGTLISSDRISNVVNCNLESHHLYIKRYYKPGKKFYSKLLASKAKKELANLLFFSQIGLHTPEVFYYSEAGNKACIVTKEVPSSTDLARYFTNNAINKTNFNYLINCVNILSKLHNYHFIHRDFKPRNVLINNKHELYLIDCPSGFKFHNFFATICSKWVQRFKIRDIALFYRDIKHILTPKQAIKLYFLYFNSNNNHKKFKLNAEHKKNIKFIINYANRKY